MKEGLKYTKRKSTATQTPETMAAEIQLALQIIAWEDYICSTTIEAGGIRVAPIWENGGRSRRDAEYQAGRVYHMFINAGLITHISGFNSLRHYLEVTPAWWNDEHHTNTIDILDEEGKVTGTTTESIKNSEVFKMGAVTGKTTYLVKITDANYQEIKKLFLPDAYGKPTKVIAENTYDEWLIANPLPITETEI